MTASARPRTAAATRAAILQSAQVAFAKAGYDGAGVREITRGAGVTPMLVKRYFGSKEGLFAEVVAATMQTANILTEHVFSSATLARDLADALVSQTKPGEAPLDGFLIMLRSASNPRAADIWRGEVERFHQRQMKAALSGQRVDERAAVVLSVIAGFQVMRQLIGLEALARADPAVLSAILEPLLRQLVADPGRATRGHD